MKKGNAFILLAIIFFASAIFNAILQYWYVVLMMSAGIIIALHYATKTNVEE